MTKEIKEIIEKFDSVHINSKQDLDDLITEIMMNYGSDGHIDGHEILTEVIWKKLGVRKK